MAEQTTTNTPLVGIPNLSAPKLKEIMNIWQNIFAKSQRVMMHMAEMQAKNGVTPIDHDPLKINRAFQELITQIFSDPQRLFSVQMSFWQEQTKLWQNMFMRAWGHNVEPYVKPHKGDRRFKHEAWETIPFFDFVKQYYLLTGRWLHNTVNNVEFKDGKKAKKVDFYTRQMIDALAPTNFMSTNPEVVFETLKTGGENLLKGLSNFLDDLERGKGQLSIKMTDLNAFKLGKNIASTAGKVIYQNDLIQLIQYQPTTTDVYAKPLLIVPPWINKFYILDLREKNSFVKWAVDQGHTVFLISWVNPDEKHANKSFDHYLLEGTLTALDVIEQATGQKEVNTVGYCLGGTLLASTLAYMTAKNDSRILSSTFFTTMLDFEEPGELEIFIDEEQIDSLEKQMNERGFLDGANMATTFTMLRANDLIWSFHIHNYLMGKEASPFDLLYWNSDSTRMPAKMHNFYLRNMYLNNLLKEPGGVTLNGEPIDLGKIKTPAYFVSTVEDHIAPWKSTFSGAQLFAGPVKFVLGGSGHIAGIINPPAANKYFYYTNPKTKTIKNPDAWLKAAKQNEGSWWTDWANWVSAFAGDKVPARVPGTGALPAIEDAPGSYVQVSVLK